MLDKHRILIWTASYSPVLGGLQTVTQQLARGLSEQGYQVMVLTNRYPTSLPAEEQDGNVIIHRIRHINPIISLSTPIGWLRWGRALLYYSISRIKIQKLIHSFNPNVINIHFPDVQSVYYNSIFTNGFSGRLIVSLHGHDILQWYEATEEDFSFSKSKPLNTKEQYKIKLLQILLEKSDGVTACSKWLAEKTAVLFPTIKNKVRVIYNGIDLNRFDFSTTLEQDNYIFSFGRLDTHKGFDLLIKAFAQIRQHYPQYRLSIAGTGPVHKQLEQLIKQLSLSEYIELIGKLNQEEIATYCKRAALIVIPSRRETFGISALEALASRRPVVATDVGGIREIGAAFNFSLYSPTVEDIQDGIMAVLKGIKQVNVDIVSDTWNHFSIPSMIQNYEILLVNKRA